MVSRGNGQEAGRLPNLMRWKRWKWNGKAYLVQLKFLTCSTQKSHQGSTTNGAGKPRAGPNSPEEIASPHTGTILRSITLNRIDCGQGQS